MAHVDPEFRDLMRRVAERSEGAVEEFVDRYGAHILRVVRRRLRKELRAQFDSSDFVQAVWASFFACLLDDKAYSDPTAVIAVLVSLARNKVVEQVRQRLHTAKYNVQRECSLQEADLNLEEQAVCRDPSPSQIAIAREEWQRLLNRAPAYRHVLQGLRDGESRCELAKTHGVSERTIRRVVQRIGGKSRE